MTAVPAIVTEGTSTDGSAVFANRSSPLIVTVMTSPTFAFLLLLSLLDVAVNKVRAGASLSKTTFPVLGSKTDSDT